jgi:peptide/nickel transport system permease protein
LKEQYSYGQEVWRSFRKNHAALGGLVVLSMIMLIAVFAYVIAPDNSTNGNRQILEIQSLKPGSGFSFLRFPGKNVTEQGLANKWLNGDEQPETLIPITSYKLSNKQIEIERYIDEDTTVNEKYRLDSLGGLEKSEKSFIENRTFLLGTDGFGRDVLSRLIIGSRISLAVGLMGMLVSVWMGLLMGMLAGYRGGRTDGLISWFLNISWAIPTLLLVFAISMVLGKGMWQIFLAVGLTMWVNVARLVRGQVMLVKKMEYIEAARVLGFSDMRILFRHILPNIAGPLIVIATANFATGVMLEAGLSFLGIGVQPPAPSWGLMIRENYNYIITGNPLPALVPGFAIMLVILSLNLIGNGLRDAIAVKN